MPDTELPPGRYLSCTIDVHPDFGGQTRALLMRNRIFAAHGVDTSVLMVQAVTDMDWRRETLRERGLLSPELDLHNIYEHYRELDWPDEEPGDEVRDLSRYLTRETAQLDGSPWRRTYRLPSGKVVHDYQRADGSTFIRMPFFVHSEPETWPDLVTKVDRQGRSVGRYKTIGGWYRRWLRDLAGDQDGFVFLDSRNLVPLVAPLKAPNLHLFYLMHNIHVGDERRWDSRVGPVYQRVLDSIGDVDAFVTLTQRQGEDIARRRGATSHMHVVPNPVDLPAARENQHRDPRQVTVVARVEGQKQVSHAIYTMERVLQALPDARLDVYGSGSRLEAVRRIVERLGLAHAVTLKGHDPHAREALWSSSVFLMTSLYEGYPLSTLESMSHGCPVVSYDVKYGPREQITDGVDGFLVPQDDVDAMAARVVQLLQDPALVARMSAASREKAAAHGYDRFLSDWATVVHAAVAARPARTRITEASLEVHRLSVGRRDSPGPVTGRRRLHLDATLHVRGQTRDGSLSDATVALEAHHRGSGLLVDLPLQVQHRDDALRLTCDVPVSTLYPSEAGAQDSVGLRVTLTWRNSSWQTYVQRTATGSTGLEVNFGPDDEWRLVRR